MSLLKRLFGGRGDGDGAAREPSGPRAAEEHKGFAIYPEPVAEGPRWRIAARIEKEVGGATKVHHLIRADVLDDREAAAEASVGKAKVLIDQQGEALFD